MDILFEEDFLFLCFDLFFGIKNDYGNLIRLKYIIVNILQCHILLPNYSKTRRVPLVEQERLTQSGNPSSPRFSVWVRIEFCRSLFVLFPLAIVFSVLLQLTDSDYSYGIFKLFLRYIEVKTQNVEFVFQFPFFFLLESL